MKKLFALAVAAVMTLGAAAENWYVGGSLGFWRDADANETTLTVAPEIGYNLSEKWAVGTEIGYGYYFEDGAKFNGFQINPYVRYSFYNNEKVNIFCDAKVDVEFGKWDYDGAKTGVNYAFGFRPGVSYALNDTFSLVAHVGFLGYQGRNDYGSYAKAGGLDLDLSQINFGFYVNF